MNLAILMIAETLMAMKSSQILGLTCMISLVGEKKPLMMIAVITVRMSVQVVQKQKLFAREELVFQKNLLEILAPQQNPIRHFNQQQIQKKIQQRHYFQKI